jgi:hypothetical protein
MSLLGNLTCGRAEEKPENRQLETDQVFDRMATR